MRGTAASALAGLALAALLLAAPSLAQTRLAWDDCGAAGVTDKTFACDVNTGEEHLFGSVILPAGLTRLVGEESTVDLMSAGADLPAWWSVGAAVPPRCRPTGVAVDFNVACASAIDYFNTVSVPLGGWGFEPGLFGADRGRIRIVSAIAESDAGSPGPVGAELFLFRIRLRHLWTVGDGACAGCEVPVCLVFGSVTLAQYSGLGDARFAPADPGYVTWQGGEVGTSVGGSGCPGAVPARPTTWGQVKSLYR